MQDRAENLAGEQLSAVDLEGARGEKGAVLRARWQSALVEQPAFPGHPLRMLLERFARRGIDDRADIGRDQQRVADDQFLHGARQHH